MRRLTIRMQCLRANHGVFCAMSERTHCGLDVLVLYWILREGRIQSAERAVPTLRSLKLETRTFFQPNASGLQAPDERRFVCPESAGSPSAYTATQS